MLVRMTTVSSAKPDRVLYDGDCGVCTMLANREAALQSPQRFTFVPYQQYDDDALAAFGLTAADCHHAVQLITKSGRVVGGPWAVNRLLLRRFPWVVIVVILYAVPILLPLEWLGYRWFARNRHLVSRWLGLDRCRIG